MRVRIACARLLVLGLVLLAAARPHVARAADVGEIALLEDTDGSINGAGLFYADYLGKASCAFFKTHAEKYDGLVFFTTIAQNPLFGVPAGARVRSPAKGIGLDLWPDGSKGFCTSGRLRHAIRMGDLAALPDSPDGPYAPSPGMSGVQVLGHELGHQWLSYVNFSKDGEKHCLLRGFVSASQGPTYDCDGHAVSDFGVHWSLYLNGASLMWGSVIEELGDGKFRLSYKDGKYTPLDQYLMGLRHRSEVPPLFLVNTGDLNGSQQAPLEPGKTLDVTGTRLDLTVDDIISAEGPRVPASESCHWKMAFVIIHAAGTPPTAAQIAKVDAYRKRWEAFYPAATDGRGSVDTTLAGTGQGTNGCPPSGVQPDGGARRDLGPTTGDAAGAAAPASGCGCEVTPASPAGSVLLLSLLAVLALLRRRRAGS